MLRQEHSGYIYLWAREGAGAAICCTRFARNCHSVAMRWAMSRWINARFVPEVLDGMEHLSLVCIDNIECIAGDELWEMAIFDLTIEFWNRAKHGC